MQYPKNGQYSKKPCANHRITDCQNKSCGFVHDICTFFQQNRCSRDNCKFVHRVSEAPKPVVQAVQPITQSVLESKPITKSVVESKPTSSDEEMMAELYAIMDDLEEEDEDEDEEDNMVLDENGVYVPIDVYMDDMNNLWGKVIAELGYTSELDVLNIFIQNLVDNYGKSESDARYEVAQVQQQNPLMLCEWILTYHGYERVTADDLYVRLMKQDKSEDTAQHIINTFFMMAYGVVFGDYNTETTE
jgi:hypothetical protein